MPMDGAAVRPAISRLPAAIAESRKNVNRTLSMHHYARLTIRPSAPTILPSYNRSARSSQRPREAYVPPRTYFHSGFAHRLDRGLAHRLRRFPADGYTGIARPGRTIPCLGTPAPTVRPALPEDPWERIQSTGVMVVGASLDYPPFEYYDENFQADGFDMALIQELGRRLGVEVEIKDMAFDGLLGAVQLGQVDAAISAISVTPDREGIVGFSNVYYVGENARGGRRDLRHHNR